jgi:hypothetical protein
MHAVSATLAPIDDPESSGISLPAAGRRAGLARGGSFARCRFARDGGTALFTAANCAGDGHLLRWEQARRRCPRPTAAHAAGAAVQPVGLHTQPACFDAPTLRLLDHQDKSGIGQVARLCGGPVSSVSGVRAGRHGRDGAGAAGQGARRAHHGRRRQRVGRLLGHRVVGGCEPPKHLPV